MTPLGGVKNFFNTHGMPFNVHISSDLYSNRFYYSRSLVNHAYPKTGNKHTKCIVIDNRQKKG